MRMSTELPILRYFSSLNRLPIQQHSLPGRKVTIISPIKDSHGVTVSPSTASHKHPESTGSTWKANGYTQLNLIIALRYITTAFQGQYGYLKTRN